MCGRYTLTVPAELVAQEFGVADPPRLLPRYNVAPSQLVAVVGLKPDGQRRGIALLRWGLVPYWTTDPKSGPKPINVRSESVLSKFGEQFRRQRCLIPVTGFYEWTGTGTGKQPHHLTRSDGGLLGIAGVWDVWEGDGQKLLTCAILTTTANELVKPYHERMPVVIPPESYAEWLDWNTPYERLTELLVPFPADLMAVAPANPVVNSVKNDGPECLEAA